MAYVVVKSKCLVLSWTFALEINYQFILCFERVADPDVPIIAFWDVFIKDD